MRDFVYELRSIYVVAFTSSLLIFYCHVILYWAAKPPIYPFTSAGHWMVSSSGLFSLSTKLPRTCTYKPLCGHMLLFLLDKYSGVNSMSHRVNTRLTASCSSAPALLLPHRGRRTNYQWLGHESRVRQALLRQLISELIRFKLANADGAILTHLVYSIVCQAWARDGIVMDTHLPKQYLVLPNTKNSMPVTCISTSGFEESLWVRSNSSWYQREAA